MAKEVIRRNGTTAEHSSFTGANSEITVDTDKYTVVVHDGSTAGGHPLLLEEHEPKTSDVHGVPSSEDIVHTGTDIEPQVKTATNASGDAPIYACRAWVNFDGTGTVSIRDSGNVSSITDNGTGDYTVNFTTSMPDANYSHIPGGNQVASAFNRSVSSFSVDSTACRVIATDTKNDAKSDFAQVTLSVNR